jgi:hypothetical protein
MPHNPLKRHPLNQSPLYAIQSRAKLAGLFGHTRKTLDTVLANACLFSTRMKEITRNGKTKVRVIQEPQGALRPIHVVVRKALSRIEPPEFLFCPVKQRSYVSNAALHVGAKEIRKLDIHAYFPSTPSRRVFWFFHKIMACSADVAAVLTKLLTVDGHLATGSTVSPILSFFAFYDMWLAIAQIAKDASCRLSVYMDDISISGDQVKDKVIWEIKKQIHRRELIAHKERRYSCGVGEVTGVLIKDGRLIVPNRQRKKNYEVRMALAATGDPVEAARLSSVLRGLNQQRAQIEG